MPHPMALFAFRLMQCQTRLQICRVQNISNVFELAPQIRFISTMCALEIALVLLLLLLLLLLFSVTFRLAHLVVGFLLNIIVKNTLL